MCTPSFLGLSTLGLHQPGRILTAYAISTPFDGSSSVDANALPNWYQQIFSFPWFRCYTLNIDDLAAAADRAFDLPRRVRQVSATNPNAPTTGSNSPEVFEVIHLNGTLDDLPDHVTFSLTQFAERLSKPDPWYTRFVADLAVNPTEETEFLLGSEPIWADLQSGRAIRRDSDDHLWSGITSVLQKNTSNLIVVTGTAGSGKSTALMRVLPQAHGAR